MYFGSAWYPEHWPESRWPEDVRLMRAAHMNVSRLAEFAWSTMEPTEGHYELDWVERAIALLHENGLAVVLGTPTAAPPAWLTHHRPDTLLIDQNGRAASHGNRCHYSPTSQTYLTYCRRIAEQMSKRFGQDTRVIGWQVDNEYSRMDYSEHTHRLFHAYLKERYHTLEALNAHWSTAYWSQTYSGWDQIPLPVGGHNPGLMLAFRHFTTKVWRDFQRVQIEAIRRYARPEQWITHNFMGWFDMFDHYKVSADLELASWDWYIGTGQHDFTKTAPIHDLTRGFKQRNFWIMETQPGSVNWSPVNNMLDKGEARCMAFHAVAHGADALLYWQWRSALGGQEQLHGSCLGADGKPRPFFTEAAQIGKDFAVVSEALEGTVVKNEVAILHSYDARWSINGQRHHKEFDPTEHLRHYAGTLTAKNVPVDVISPDLASVPTSDQNSVNLWAGYKLVIAPALVVFTEAAIIAMTAFVEAGGTLVLTIRCGQKDAYNALFPTLQPGPLRELAGVEVEEFYALDEEVPVQTEAFALGGGTSGEMTAGLSRLWAERLRPLNAATEVLATWGESNGWLDGTPAMTRHRVGDQGGQVIYVGAYFDAAMQSALLDWLIDTAKVTPLARNAPAGVEDARRVRPDDSSIYILINHERKPQHLALTAPLPNPAVDLLTGETFQDMVALPEFGVRVFQVLP